MNRPKNRNREPLASSPHPESIAEPSEHDVASDDRLSNRSQLNQASASTAEASAAVYQQAAPPASPLFSPANMPQYTSRDVGDPSQIKKNKQSMADLKLRRLTELNNRLREDLERERIPVSQASKR